MQNQRFIGDPSMEPDPDHVCSRLLLHVLLIALIACTSGCSGLLTDSMNGGDFLSSQTTLAPQDGIESETRFSSTGDRLDELVNGNNETDFPVSPTNHSPAAADETEPVGFQFSTDLPELPALAEGSSTAASTATPLDMEAVDFIHEPSEALEKTHSTVKLVATTQPIEASKNLIDSVNSISVKSLDLQPHAKAPATPIAETDFIPSTIPETIPGVAPEAIVNVVPDAIPQLLQPLADHEVAQATRAPESSKSFELEQGLPAFSDADYQRVTRAAFEASAMSSHESVDLSKLELDSNLIEPPPARDSALAKESLSASEHLTETIRMLRETLDDQDSNLETNGAEVSAKLLEILQTKIDEISSHPWQMSRDEHQYWQQQIKAVSVMFASDLTESSDNSNPSRHQTASEAITYLERAADHLRSIAGLKIQGGQLCSQIFGFGQFQELESNRFQPGDQALVYVELENQSSQRVSQKRTELAKNNFTWQTRLQAHYTIVNQNGEMVQQQAYPVIEDFAQQRRRDFYLHLPLTIPELPPGNYEFLISVDDLESESSADLSPISFSVSNLAD